MTDLGGEGRKGIYLTDHLLFTSLFVLFLEKKLFLHLFSLFKVYKYEILSSYSYSSYLDYKHKVIYAT